MKLVSLGWKWYYPVYRFDGLVGWLTFISRLKRENLFAQRIEVDAPLFNVSDVAKMGRLRGAMPYEHVPIGTLPCANALDKVIYVIERHVVRLSLDNHRSHVPPKCGWPEH